MESIQAFLVTDKAVRFEDCISWARLKFEDLFGNQIKQLLYNFPKDSVTSTGASFWSGPKRAPDAVVFDTENVSLLYDIYIVAYDIQPLHMDFIVYAANLHAFNYGLKGETDRAYYKKVLSSIMVPEFSPKQGVKIQVNENENVQASTNGTPFSLYLRQFITDFRNRVAKYHSISASSF